MSSLKIISSKMVTRINVILETILILSMRIFYIKLIRTEYSLSLIQCNFSSANNIGRTFKLLNFKLKKGKSLSRYTKNFIIFTSFYPCQDSKSQHFVFNIFIINRIELQSILISLVLNINILLRFINIQYILLFIIFMQINTFLPHNSFIQT